MDAFRLEFQPKLFTLKNDGVLCYFNSLIQALMSCPALNAYLSDHASEFAKNALAQAYLALLMRNALPIASAGASTAGTPTAGEKFTPIHIDDVSSLLRLLVVARTGKKDNLSSHKQEDAQEGFVLLLDALGDEVSKKFQVRYKCELCCRQCRDRHFVDNEQNKEPTEMMIDLSEEYLYADAPLNTKENIEAYIHRNMQVPRDYKCEKCGAHNSYDAATKLIAPNICQNYILARVSEVVVLLFKKYDQKRLRYFPQTLDFKSRSGLIQYRLVAQIEHFGSTSGGHYRVKCLRAKPPGLHTMRRMRAQKIRDQYTKQLDSIQLRASHALYNTIEYEAKIADIEKNIEEDHKLAVEPMGVFLIDDERVSFCPEGFAPTPNTYMVFYHLFQRN